MILHDRWPGDPGRKQKSLNQTKIKNVPGNINNTLVAGTPVSTTTTPSGTSVMTGSMLGGMAVNTLGSSSVLTQPVLPAQSALHSFPCPSIVPATVHIVVTNSAQCYSSTLQAATCSATVTVSCVRPVLSVSRCYSSAIHQSGVTKTGGKIRGSGQNIL